MVVVITFQTGLFAEGIVEVHGASADDGERIGDTAVHQELGDVVGDLHFHGPGMWVLVLGCSLGEVTSGLYDSELSIPDIIS